MSRKNAEIAKRLFKDYSTLLTNREIEFMLDACNNSDLTKRNSARESLDVFLREYYQNEAIVKAAFLEKVLFRQEKSTTVAFEVPVGDSRVDLCKLGRQSVAYEIKTEYDSFMRLKTQLKDYEAAFDYIYLIVSEKKIERLPTDLASHIGIYVFKKWGNSLSFKRIRKAKKSELIDPYIQVSALSKSELKKAKESQDLIRWCAVDGDNLDWQDKKRINLTFKKALRARYQKHWAFLLEHKHDICSIDYSWFFHNMIDPEKIYKY